MLIECDVLFRNKDSPVATIIKIKRELKQTTKELQIIQHANFDCLEVPVSLEF